MIRARDIMSEDVIVVRPDMLVRQVAHLMLRDRVSGFPVVEEGRGIVGIISMKNFFRMIHSFSQAHKIDAFYRALPKIQEKAVIDFMSTDVITLAPDTNLSEILRLLIEHDTGTFPVMEDHKMVGIVSLHDILNAVFSFDPDA